MTYTVPHTIDNKSVGFPPQRQIDITFRDTARISTPSSKVRNVNNDDGAPLERWGPEGKDEHQSTEIAVGQTSVHTSK
jgi:hypothetical protein